MAVRSARGRAAGPGSTTSRRRIALNRTLVFLLGLLCAGRLLAAPTETAVLDHYADLAHTKYGDALTTAVALQQAVDRFLARPDSPSLAAARAAWKAARVPYSQTEAYRFGNPVVDTWEPRINAWPLDEGLIDYVADSYGTRSDNNPFYRANVIANDTLDIGGQKIDARRIDRALLRKLNEAGGVTTNVATGYHAIEFLLWGQDLNGTGPGAGDRPATDYDRRHCTHGHCERRAAYLRTATALLVDDLRWMTAQWDRGGSARKALESQGTRKGLAAILTGMGSLSFGELAGERLRLGLMLHDPEEEQDCFSDNTHWSHYYDAVGIRDVYLGTYTRSDGRMLSGPSLSDLVAAAKPDVDRQMRERLDGTVAKMQVLVDSAEKDGIAYDQLIAEGNEAGNAKVEAAVQALMAQTRAIEQVVAALGLESLPFGSSEALDSPEGAK